MATINSPTFSVWLLGLFHPVFRQFLILNTYWYLCVAAVIYVVSLWSRKPFTWVLLHLPECCFLFYYLFRMSGILWNFSRDFKSSFNDNSLQSIESLPLWCCTTDKAPLLARGCHCSPCNKKCRSLVSGDDVSSVFWGVCLVWAYLSCSPPSSPVQNILAANSK